MRKQKEIEDFNEVAFRVIQSATRHKNPHAVAMARARKKSLSPERRSEIARKAARARWEKRAKP
jgi:hypothetical protein